MGNLMTVFPGLPFSLWSAAVAAIIFDLLLYTFLALTVRQTETSGRRWNPLAITAGIHGRASLANLQILYFSLIVFWVAVYAFFRHAQLPQFSSDVLLLLGIGVAGTAGAKIVATQQGSVSFANKSWLRCKGWIKQDIGPNRRPPEWADLVTSEGIFDAFKFQSFAASLIVGIAFLVSSLDPATASGPGDFDIPDVFLALLGLSQAGYVGGKAITPAPVAELDRQLTKVREREARLQEAVAAKSQSRGSSGDDSPEKLHGPGLPEYDAYMADARIAAQMVHERTGNSIAAQKIDPEPA